MPGTYRQLASSSISPLKQPVPCPPISVLLRALGVSPSALFSVELGRSPLRLHRARLGVLLCLEVTSTDPFPPPPPPHTQGPWSSCPEVFPALLTLVSALTLLRVETYHRLPEFPFPFSTCLVICPLSSFRPSCSGTMLSLSSSPELSTA